MTVWRLMTHRSKDHPPMLGWSLTKKRIAIGWGGIGDIKQKGYGSPEEIAEAIKRIYPTEATKAAQGGRCLWSFCHEMAEGDLVILREKNRKEVVVVTGDGYEWIEKEEEPVGNYQHQRKIRCTDLNADEVLRKAGAKACRGFNIHWAFIPLTDNQQSG